MDFYYGYFIPNFALIVLSIGLFFIVFYDSRFKGKNGLCTLAIILIALLLSVFDTLSDFFSDSTTIPSETAIFGATMFSFLGYITRPFILYFFLLLARINLKKRESLLLLIPGVLNIIVYLFAFIPATKEQVFWFVPSDTGTGYGANWQGGPLRFSAHIVSALYLIYLLYLSLKGLKGRHKHSAIAVLSCTFFVVLAVILESFFNDDGSVRILNITSTITCTCYYLFLRNQLMKKDMLTQLFTRATYYHDIERFGKDVNAVINVDMNGLKYLNDTFGHEEGDKALVCIANAIIKHETKEMYAYRLGGDEYIILGLRVTMVELDTVCQNIKSELTDSRYSCSIGAVYKTDKNQTLDDLLKQAEIAMYKDKERFYKTSNIERRKAREV